MKGIKNHMYEAVNNVAGSIGNILTGHSEELANITNKEDLLQFLEEVIRPEIAPRFQDDMDALIKEVNKMRQFLRAYRVVYNYLLAGLDDTFRLALHQDDIPDLHMIGWDDEKHLISDIETEIGDISQGAFLDIIGFIPIGALDRDVAIHSESAHSGSDFAEHSVELIGDIFKHFFGILIINIFGFVYIIFFKTD